MKRLVLLSALGAGLLSTVSASAQSNPGVGAVRVYRFLDLGVKAGLNMQQIVAYPFASTYSQGYMGGFYLEKRMNKVALRVELTGSTTQFTTDNPATKKYSLEPDAVKLTDTSKGDFNIIFANLPVMVVFKLGRHGNMYMGGQYSRAVSIKDNNGVFSKKWGTEKVIKDGYFSGIFGLEFEMFKRLRLGASYTQGVSDMNNMKYPGIVGKWVSGAGQAYLSYKIKRWY
ncbi:MAG: PorT family protein [Gammaproteobacteria bacterium]|nr:PorT family protein [Gammaproteobacteria bacterium]